MTSGQVMSDPKHVLQSCMYASRSFCVLITFNVSGMRLILLLNHNIVKQKFHAVKIVMLGDDFEPGNTGPVE